MKIAKTPNILGRLSLRRSLYGLYYYYAPDHREGGNKRCFCLPVCQSVRLSVCPSIAYIANNSRTQRPSCPNLEWRFLTLDAIRTPVSRSEVKGQGYRRAGAYRVDRTQRPQCLLLLLPATTAVACGSKNCTWLTYVPFSLHTMCVVNTKEYKCYQRDATVVLCWQFEGTRRTTDDRRTDGNENISNAPLTVDRRRIT